MRILHVCSELYPILKTGGLADVAGALPLALESLGSENRVLVPGFPAFMEGINEKEIIADLTDEFGGLNVKVLMGKLPGTNITAYIIESPDLYDRSGNPYADSNNQPYSDNYRRFALLGWIAAKIANDLDPNWRPQVLHGHDWHAGLAPAYIKAMELTQGVQLAGSVFTVHNLAYQGVFPAYTFAELNLPNHFYNVNGLEFYSQLSFLKAGLFYADKITTVSPTYAKEIQTEEQGCGLQGLLNTRRNDLSGILNGVDENVWNPAKDPIIAANYTAKSLTGKQKCRIALQEYAKISVQDDKPIFVVVSRLTEQKGLNLVLAGIDEIIEKGGQLVILGSGDKELEKAYKAIAKKHKDQVSVQIGYDEEHAHRLIAGGDIILVPSRFEPCGLTQLYGLLYGTLPLVHNVGGLHDTVTDSSLENLAEDTATGFIFNDFELDAYKAAVKRAFALYSRKADWKKTQKRAMQSNFGWSNSATEYLQIYKQIAR